MANASMEKLKALGLRQGEKFVVGIAVTVLVVCLGLAATRTTIATSPDELQKKAEQADSNLGRKQDAETILTRVEEAGIKDPGFVKIVENQATNALKPSDYRVKLDWVIPEPGAGLIRDTPEIIAPTELAVFPGRGGMLLFTLDDKKNRIPDTSALAAGGRNEGRGTYRGGRGGRGEKPEDAAKRQEAEKQKLQRLMAGNVDAAKKEDKDKAEPAKAEPADPVDTGPWKEDTVGKRWVVITGVINNEQMNKNWLLALKNPAIAFPQYNRVDAERQIRQSDGSWSDPAAVDEDAKYKVLENLPEADEELIPLVMRPEALVDQLPFLRAGYWTGVHVARLVPAEVRDGPAADVNAGNMRGPGGPGGKMMGMDRGPTGAMGPRGGAGMMAGGDMGEGMRGGMGPQGGGQPDEAVTANSEATLMLRSLDFSVEPNTTYRYRLRLVVKNPNFERSDVNPGVDTSSKELIGPWSEPTEAVSVPADVSAYAQSSAQDNRRDDVVMFQVVRWNPATGQTVLKTDDAAPGFLIGDNGTVQEPSSEGGGAKSVTIDFNSRSFVLDSLGGRIRIPDIGVERNSFTVPAVAMVVEPDGSVVIRSQARDRSDEVREDMDANYRQALEDSGKKREKGSGTRRARSGRGAKQGGGRSAG